MGGGGADVRSRLRMSFSSAQRLARASVAAAAVLGGGWDAALRVGLRSRRPAAASVVLRGAEGKSGSLGRWRREGEEGGRSGEMATRAMERIALACVVSGAFAAAAAGFGDGGRAGVDVSRFRERAGIGLDR